MHTRRDRSQPFGTVVHRVQTGDHRKEHLRSTDIARGLLPTDVLLACLQCEPQRAPTLGIHRHADEPARQRALVCVPTRDVSRVRSAVSERHPESLRRAHNEVRTHCARRLQQHQREEVCGHCDEAAFVVDPCNQCRVVDHCPTAARIREQHAEEPSTGNVVGRIADDHLDVQGFGAPLHDCDRLGVTVGVKEEHVPTLGCEPATHGHSLGRGRRFVEQRRIRQVHAREVRHHRLEVEQRLEPPLGDLGLIRRVRGVPGRVLEHVATDHAGSDRVRVAHADHRRRHHVAVGQDAQRGDRLHFRTRLGQRKWLGPANRLRYGGIGQRVERIEPEHFQHCGLLGLVRADVTIDEPVTE